MPQVTYYVAMPFHFTDEGEMVAGARENAVIAGAARSPAMIAANPKIAARSPSRAPPARRWDTSRTP